MNKQRSINSKKRREARKHRNAIKRKAQVRSNASGEIRLPYSIANASVRKLSEVVLEFGEPLTHAVEGTDAEKNAIIMSVLLWNASFLPKEKALETITPAFHGMAKGDPALKSEFHSIFDMMYERKRNYYSADNRCIVDYSVEKNRDGFYLQVASTPFTNSNLVRRPLSPYDI